jgi:hypothetical protein
MPQVHHFTCTRIGCESKVESEWSERTTPVRTPVGWFEVIEGPDFLEADRRPGRLYCSRSCLVLAYGDIEVAKVVGPRLRDA